MSQNSEYTKFDDENSESIEPLVLHKVYEWKGPSPFKLTNMKDIRAAFLDFRFSESLSALKSMLKENEFDENSLLAAKIQNDIACIEYMFGRYENAINRFEITRSIYNSNKDLDTEIQQAILDLNVGSCYRIMCRYQEAYKYLQNADSKLKKNSEALDDIIGCLLDETGCYYRDYANYNESMKYFFKAIKHYEEKRGIKCPDIARIFDNLAHTYRLTGKYNESLEYHFKAQAIYKSIGPDSKLVHPGMGANWIGMGVVRRLRMEYIDAQRNLNQAQKLYLRYFGEQHIELAKIFNNIGLIDQDQGNYAKSMLEFQKCLNIHNNNGLAEHFEVAKFYNNLGLSFDALENGDYAIEYYLKAEILTKKLLSDNHPSLASYYNNIGVVYKKKNMTKEAIEYYQKCRKIMMINLDRDHPHYADILFNIGLMHYSKSRLEDTSELLKKTIFIYQKGFGEGHFKTIRVKAKVQHIEEENARSNRFIASI